ncbi:Eukaryotic translation initiation factor 3 subunit F-1 [Plutella xylostella]|uniref:Eukaryotic translation initiation factor 3 subunit F n=1 Tax=Plutella xylostella TaxID=51655 RepID=A0ABQ7QB04_PLUXY|nr:eukaryotic translation initiation factor 3 subunit F [Plutella xylostella]KAG7302319.1 Eukaryotic translation initiation factor 3 subunit F-1 [Plutella xylostella]
MALNLSVKIHPVVLFQIVDAYERRNADSHRVIGTLLGTADKGVVEVTNCFCVPHKEHADQVEAELNYAMDVYELNRRVNATENIIGWWATGNEVTNHSSVIHEYYSRECREPVHVTLDTSLQGGRMGLRAYVCVALGVPGGKQGCMFTPIDVSLTSYEPEIVGLQLCQKTMAPNGRSRQVQPMQDLAQVSEAAAKLSTLIEQVLQYVEDVLAEKTVPNNAVGRQLLELVNSVPNLAADSFTDAFASSIKDLLMVVTLAQLIKTQLQLNEKLTLLTGTQ